MYEVFAYYLQNGENHYKKNFKPFKAELLIDIDAWEKKVKKRYEKKYNSPCNVYAVYKKRYDEIKL